MKPEYILYYDPEIHSYKEVQDVFNQMRENGITLLALPYPYSLEPFSKEALLQMKEFINEQLEKLD